MKIAPILGILIAIALAIALHAGFLLFGGILFPGREKDHGTLQQVELLSEEEAEEEQEEEKPEEPAEETEDLEAEVEEAPDAAAIMRDLERSAAAAAPALEAASLSAIEAALSGQSGGGGDFAEALTFSSGGRIGGMGKPGGALDDKFESAFSLAEIDQKPRAIFQASPAYPSEMRGKKVVGVVTVIFVVDPGGKVANPRVEKSNHAAFNKPALEAVKQWKFEPAVKGGQRVPCKMRVPIQFPSS